jgi:hypothetical protein
MVFGVWCLVFVSLPIILSLNAWNIIIRHTGLIIPFPYYNSTKELQLYQSYGGYGETENQTVVL